MNLILDDPVHLHSGQAEYHFDALTDKRLYEGFSTREFGHAIPLHRLVLSIRIAAVVSGARRILPNRVVRHLYNRDPS